ncbi:uncharacterized protein [Cicer arietinum]|uniref:Uncharacterized protein LOC101508676 isoform X2 n=1 Tax=Cicer arietinum TaxID=3827 RepID=A0A1S3E8J4_CICAR|nr:uncharacterized protein LOC101508676 isoform X2 [Cicer arietinum]
MAGFLTDLAKPYVEKLINGALAESSYICCFMCIAKDFEEEKARLEAERTTFKQRVDVVTRRGEEVPDNALYWEEEAYKLIQEDTKTKQKCVFGFCPHCIWRYRRGKELANKKEHIKRLMETGKELAIGLPARLPDVERYSSQHYISFKSRESKYKELLEALKDDNIYIIGLQGMGGTGKTTLAKQVGKELKQYKLFNYVIDTTVSNSPDIKKIQDDIAGPLGLKWDDCTESDRPKKLWGRLTNGEKILLILDDVWGDIDFDEIGIPYSDNHKGCRVLVTTRKMLVCNKMGCSKTIQLELLSKEDAWIMFKRYASLSDSSPKSLLDKGCKIANECKKLPIAIAVIASSLKGEQHHREWEVALKSLQKHMSMHSGDEDDDELVKIYKCLKFSYDNIKDEKAKRLFLLCSVFPEDEDIPLETLTRLGIAAGLFGEDYGSYEDARSKVHISKNKLLDSCLLLEVDQWSVKMHDLVRDAAQWIANKEIQTVNLYDENQKAMVERENNIKYLLCKSKQVDVFSHKLYGSKLEMLIVVLHKDGYCRDEKIEVPNSFFENNIGLRVLLVSYPYESTLSLPQSIQSLKNIRSLLFLGVDLGDISILVNLQSLETLDFHHCKMNELPHEITKLKKFKLLKLKFCGILRNNPFEVIKGCSSLEELYFISSFNGFCQEITFPKLQRFVVSEYKNSKIDSSSKFMSLVENDEIFLSESTLKYCMQTAEVLRLRRINKRNLIPEIVPEDQGMSDLAELGLSCNSQIQCLIDTKHSGFEVPNVFSKLVVLVLSKLENLEELCNGPLSFDSFKSLEKLSIMGCEHLQSLFKCNLNLCNLKSVSLRECPMLISLFQLSTCHSLMLLEMLEIIHCGRLEYIIMDERKGEELRDEIGNDDNDSRSHGSLFPKLKDLNIQWCSGFEFLLSFPFIQDLPALESITIHNCDKLQYIFGQDVKLGSLKQMKFDGLPNFIDIFPKCDHTMTFSFKEPSFISTYASKPQTQLVPIKCNIISWMSTACTKIPLAFEDEQQDCLISSESNSYGLNIWERAHCLSRQSHILCYIKEIVLTNISKIKSVFILAIAPKMLLETLTIRNCNALKNIIIDTGDHDSGVNNWGNVFPKLKKIFIKGCMKLEYIFGYYADDLENHTEIHIHLPTLKCLILQNLPSLVAMCLKQYQTTFPPLEILNFKNCSKVDIKSIGDFMKRLSGNAEHLRALEWLEVYNTKVENIYFFNELNVRQINLGLQRIELDKLPLMTCLFVGPKNSIALKNITWIKINRCEKLKAVFSTCIIKCLQQLVFLRIEECKELKHIIEDDSENLNSLCSRTCFPNLKAVVIVKCNKLKSVIPVSLCKALPELVALMIREADELEEIFKSEGHDDHKVEIPNLRVVAFDNLPSLYQAQGIHFQAVKKRFIQNCQKLSLTLASTTNNFKTFDIYSNLDLEIHIYLEDQFPQLRQKIEGCDTGNESSSAETTQDFATGIEVEAAPGHELTSSQMNEPSIDKQHSLGQIDTTVQQSHQNYLEGSTSEKTAAATLSTISETKNEPSIQLVADLKQKGIEISVEEGSTSTSVKTITSSSTHLELEEDGDGQIAMTSFPIATTETINDQVSLNDDVAMQASSIVEKQFPKDDETKISKSRLSSVASQFPSMPSKGDPSQTVEDLSSSLLVTRELEQLIAKNNLVYENLSVLTDFLVKHPSGLLRDTSLSNRYKGYAYNCLAELLKFLQTQSVLDVLGSSHSKFVELLQDARSFGFDKDWLDGVERRALFPELQVSQDAFQKLLDSKQQVTKEVEVLRLKIDILSQCVEDLNYQLTSSEAVLESIVQQEATLSAPIGY